MTTVHRAGINGLPKCGAKEGKISHSGVSAFITCSKCKELSREATKEDIEKRMSEVLGYTVKL